MPKITNGLIHIAGNTVLDVLLRDVHPPNEPATDNWGNNTQLLQRPIEATLGGCGAATAYLLGQLGQTVTLNSNIGNDIWGNLLKSWLEPVNVELCSTSTPASAVHIITLDPEGKRRSFYHTGAKVDWQHSLTEPTPQWFFASGYGGVNQSDAEQLLQVFTELHQRGSQIAFDPSPWFAGRIDLELMLTLFSQTDCLLGTLEEFSFWFPQQNTASLADQLLVTGPGKIVIKCGADGAFYADASGQRDHISTESVANANSVGAGDSFNARLLFGLCQGESLATATAAAVKTATAVVKQGRGVLGAVIEQ